MGRAQRVAVPSVAVPSVAVPSVAVAILALAAACGGATPFYGPTARVEGRTEVVLVGTVGLRHHDHEGYPTSAVASLLRAYGPDVVLVDVPPAAFERVLAAAPSAAAVAEDEWLRTRPELHEAVLPLARELSLDIVPVSGFEGQMRLDWAAYWSANPAGPESPDWRQAVAAFSFGWREAPEDEFALYINGPGFARQTRWVRQSLSAAADEELGAAAVYVVEEAQFERVRAAIAAHAGRRIAVVFGARHLWYLAPRVAALEGVTVLDARAFVSAEHE